MSLLSFGKKQKEKNINLLPDEAEESFSIRRDLVLALLTPFATLVLIGIVFVTLFLLEKQQAIKNSNINKAIDEKTTEWKQFSNTANSIKSIKTNYNNHIAKTEQNQKVIYSLQAVRSVVPNAVVLKKLKTDTTGSVTVDGTASDPATIYQFVEELNSDPATFKDVNLNNIGLSDSTTGTGGFNFGVSLKVITDEEESN